MTEFGGNRLENESGALFVISWDNLHIWVKTIRLRMLRSSIGKFNLHSFLFLILSVKWWDWRLKLVSEGKLWCWQCFYLQQQVFLQNQTLLTPQGVQIKKLITCVFVGVCTYEPGLNLKLPILGCSLIKSLMFWNCSERMWKNKMMLTKCQKKSKKY